VSLNFLLSSIDLSSTELGSGETNIELCERRYSISFEHYLKYWFCRIC